MRNLMIGCAVAAVVALSATTEARVPARLTHPAPLKIVATKLREVGVASWYGMESAGLTATGEVFDMNALTAAHRTLPLNCTIKVTNLNNGRSVVLRVNDRGPNVGCRLLDVSRAAAERLGFVRVGTARVQLHVLRYPKGYVAPSDPSNLTVSCAAPPA